MQTVIYPSTPWRSFISIHFSARALERIVYVFKILFMLCLWYKDDKKKREDDKKEMKTHTVLHETKMEFAIWKFSNILSKAFDAF